MRHSLIICTIIVILAEISSCKKNSNNNLQGQVSAQGQVNDIDGNTYDTVHIGTQIWMKENLKTEHYSNGDAITEVEDSTAWDTNATTPAWCYYSGNASNNGTYGKLYNWYAVTDPRELCPTGWHVASDSEWTILVNYLGGNALAGGHMKAITLWQSPNTGADNSSGFNALPGGLRAGQGHFYAVGIYGIFWSTTPGSSGLAHNYNLFNNNGSCLNYDYGKANGYSVRCVKN